MNEQKENRTSRLTVEQKKYLENGILNNFKNKDIAKILGISVSRVSSYKSRNATTIGLPKAPIIRNWREEKYEPELKDFAQTIQGFQKAQFPAGSWLLCLKLRTEGHLEGVGNTIRGEAKVELEDIGLVPKQK